MARVSFTIRRPVPDHGSYARFDSVAYQTSASAGNSASPGYWTGYNDRDVDQYLRSDGIQTAPVEATQASLSATSPSYGVVQLEWEVPIYDTTDGYPTVTPDVVDAVIVYSPVGEPYSLESGEQLVVDYGLTKSFRHTAPEGKWAYYSIFAHFAEQEEGSISQHYSYLASVKVLVPANYNSTKLLWDRIPEYYREADYALGTPLQQLPSTVVDAIPSYTLDKVGPLYRFLSIFGFEMDRARTLIDHFMISYDPSVADTETLDALSSQMGINLSSFTVGASRLRYILEDIGNYSRSKGTISAFDYIIKSLAGGQVDLDVDNKSISIYAHRSNYATDPVNMSGKFSHRTAHFTEQLNLNKSYYQQSYDPSSYSAGASATYPQPRSVSYYVQGMHWTAASAGTMGTFDVEVGDTLVAYGEGRMDHTEVQFAVIPESVTSTNYGSAAAYTSSGNSLIPVSSFSNGLTYGLIKLTDPVPVVAGDSVVMSVHSNVGTDYLTNNVTTSVIKLVRLRDASDNIIGYTRVQSRAGDAPAFAVQVPSDLSTGWHDVYVEFMVDMEEVKDLTGQGYFKLGRVLLERNHFGRYFDGNNVTGSWLVDDAGTLSDYRWSVGAGSSVSVYTDHFTRVRSEVDKMKDEALPVTESFKYSIVNYSKIPGQELLSSVAPGTVP